MKISDWHARYLQQAGWTHSARNYLLSQINLDSGSKCLEVGVGTGAVAAEISKNRTVSVFGVDIDYSALSFAHHDDLTLKLSLADGCRLPFADNAFSFCFCHYLLLWVDAPVSVLSEMKRVTTPGGYIVIMAEPDYGGSVCYPDEFADIAKQQRLSLIKQGADPYIGRKISSLLYQAGLGNHTFGVIGGEWNSMKELQEYQNKLDLMVLEEDMKALGNTYSTQLYSGLKQQGSMNFTPTFFALAQK